MLLLGVSPPKAAGSGNTNSISLVASSSQYLSRADEALFDLNTNLTFELWYKPTSTPANGTERFLINKRNATGNQRSYSFAHQQIAGVERLNFAWSNSGTGIDEEAIVNQTLTNNTWYHVAVTKAGTSVKLYLNGAQIGSTYTATNGTIFNSTAQFAIGSGEGGTTGFLDGLVDDVRMWSLERTAAEINANKSKQINTATNLDGSWHLNNVLTDASGNALTLTNNGGSTFSTDVPF